MIKRVGERRNEREEGRELSQKWTMQRMGETLETSSYNNIIIIIFNCLLHIVMT